MSDIINIVGGFWLIGCAITWIFAESHMISPPNPAEDSELRRHWFIARFDKWMGLYQVAGTKSAGYWDKKAYWLPLPCIGIKITRKRRALNAPKKDTA